MSLKVHVAGSHITIGNLMRQRCAWCDHVLIDLDLERVGVPADQPGPPAMWPVGDLIAVDGNVAYVVAHVDGDQLPEEACARIDPLPTEPAADEPDYIKTYREFWAGIVAPDGILSLDQVARELSDYSIVMQECSKVYEELAGLSKPNTAAVHILDGAERKYAETYADYLCDHADEADAEGKPEIGEVLRDIAEQWLPGSWAAYTEAKERSDRIRAQVGTRYRVYVDKSSIGQGLVATMARNTLEEAESDFAVLQRVEPYPLIMFCLPAGHGSWQPMPAPAEVQP